MSSWFQRKGHRYIPTSPAHHDVVTKRSTIGYTRFDEFIADAHDTGDDCAEPLCPQTRAFLSARIAECHSPSRARTCRLECFKPPCCAVSIPQERIYPGFSVILDALRRTHWCLCGLLIVLRATQIRNRENASFPVEELPGARPEW